jgi:catechol 2,3-dioxygenase
MKQKIMNFKLSPQITISDIELTIQNLDHATDFYTKVIGLKLQARTQNSADLGIGNTTLIRLFENPQAQKSRGTTGLYHFAILVPGRQILAKSLQNIIDTQTPVQGFADHGVSEAIYLPDSDGNGIEIYRDRPYQEWPFENGELQMVTDPLDMEGLLSELNGSNGHGMQLPADTTIGHMHLHVRDIPEAVNFYRDVLGFELKQRYGSSAAFLASGNYHHHIGINTWAGVGAPPAPAGSVGLRSFTINLPTMNDLDALERNIRQTRNTITPTDNGFSLHDPSNNYVQFKFAKPDA